MTGDWGRRSKGRIQQEQGLPILSTRFCKSSAWTLLHTALPVSEHCDESIAVRRRELRSCGYSISPPSAALTIARMLARTATSPCFAATAFSSCLRNRRVPFSMYCWSRPNLALRNPCHQRFILLAAADMDQSSPPIGEYATMRITHLVCRFVSSQLTVTARLKSDHATIKRPKTRWRSSSYMKCPPPIWDPSGFHFHLPDSHRSPGISRLPRLSISLTAEPRLGIQGN